MQITDLYQTKITCSTYNANIDSTDTVITVKLVDFNGNAVTNKSVTLTCDRGYFNKNGSTTISGTTTKSITATTNSNGEITATWTASEWGLCTFSANTISMQVNVKGIKQVYNQNNITIKTDGKIAYLYFQKTMSLPNGETRVTSIDSQYAPVGIVEDFLIQYNCKCRLDGTNFSVLNIATAISSTNVRGMMTYMLANPL